MWAFTREFDTIILLFPNAYSSCYFIALCWNTVSYTCLMELDGQMSQKWWSLPRCNFRQRHHRFACYIFEFMCSSVYPKVIHNTVTFINMYVNSWNNAEDQNLLMKHPHQNTWWFKPQTSHTMHCGTSDDVMLYEHLWAHSSDESGPVSLFQELGLRHGPIWIPLRHNVVINPAWVIFSFFIKWKSWNRHQTDVFLCV